jgi:hypothetical protein
MQLFARISNPWDLKKVRPGEIDLKTGDLKKQKHLYVVVLVGSRFLLDHVLELSYPSLAAIGCQAKQKDVDALESSSLFSFVGLPNDWDSVSLTIKLQKDLERHEEWMQANVKAGYNARQFMGTVFPSLIVRRAQIRLPEGKDVLDEEENEAIQYAFSLRKLNTVEVSASDDFRVKMALLDFQSRGKLRSYSQDCDLLPLNITSKHNPSARLEFLRHTVSQMNYHHVHSSIYFDGISLPDYPARGEMDPCYHDGRKAFKNTSIRRETLDIRRPDGTRVFLGAIEGSGDNEGRMMVYFFNSDENDAFVAGICGNLPMYLYAYLKNVKGYSERSINAILSGCAESYRLGARDSKWDGATRAIQPLSLINRSDFVSKMAKQNMHTLLPEVRLTFSKQAQAEKKKFSDAAKEAVAQGLRFKDKPGYNPTSTDAASVLTNKSHSTTGAASNRSVTTADIQGKLPELRSELNQLRQRLLEASPDDEFFNHQLMRATNVDDLSVNSSASAQLAAFYKDTQQCIFLLKARLCELGEDGNPPPASGSTGPSPSPEEGSRGAVQGA